MGLCYVEREGGDYFVSGFGENFDTANMKLEIPKTANGRAVTGISWSFMPEYDEDYLPREVWLPDTIRVVYGSSLGAINEETQELHILGTEAIEYGGVNFGNANIYFDGCDSLLGIVQKSNCYNAMIQGGYDAYTNFSKLNLAVPVVAATDAEGFMALDIFATISLKKSGEIFEPIFDADGVASFFFGELSDGEYEIYLGEFNSGEILTINHGVGAKSIVGISTIEISGSRVGVGGPSGSSNYVYFGDLPYNFAEAPMTEVTIKNTHKFLETGDLYLGYGAMYEGEFSWQAIEIIPKKLEKEAIPSLLPGESYTFWIKALGADDEYGEKKEDFGIYNYDGENIKRLASMDVFYSVDGPYHMKLVPEKNNFEMPKEDVGIEMGEAWNWSSVEMVLPRQSFEDNGSLTARYKIVNDGSLPIEAFSVTSSCGESVREGSFSYIVRNNSGSIDVGESLEVEVTFGSDWSLEYLSMGSCELLFEGEMGDIGISHNLSRLTKNNVSVKSADGFDELSKELGYAGVYDLGKHAVSQGELPKKVDFVVTNNSEEDIVDLWMHCSDEGLVDCGRIDYEKEEFREVEIFRIGRLGAGESTTISLPISQSGADWIWNNNCGIENKLSVGSSGGYNCYGINGVELVAAWAEMDFEDDDSMEWAFENGKIFPYMISFEANTQALIKCGKTGVILESRDKNYMFSAGTKLKGEEVPVSGNGILKAYSLRTSFYRPPSKVGVMGLSLSNYDIIMSVPESDDIYVHIPIGDLMDRYESFKVVYIQNGVMTEAEDAVIDGNYIVVSSKNMATYGVTGTLKSGIGVPSTGSFSLKNDSVKMGLGGGVMVLLVAGCVGFRKIKTMKNGRIKL